MPDSKVEMKDKKVFHSPTCSESDSIGGMYPPLLIPAKHVYPVVSVADQGLYFNSSVQREEVIHCASVTSCLRTIGEITTNHPGN